MTDTNTEPLNIRLYKEYIAKLEREAKDYQYQIEVLKGERRVLTDQLIAANTTIDALRVQIQALDRRVTTLEQNLATANAEISMMKATWTPPVAKQADMWIGATINAKAGETYAQAFLRWEQAKGRIGVIRTFNNSLPATFQSSNSSTQMLNRHRIVSVKGDGATPEYWDRYIASIPQDKCPTGEPCVTALAIWHEPENNGGTMTPTKYKAACNAIDAAIVRSGRKDLIAAVILMTWLEEDRDGGTSSGDWMPDNAHRFALLVDPYDPNNSRTLWSKIEATLALWRAKGGVFWGVSETASHRTGTDLATWIREGFLKCKSEGALFWCWFHSAVGTQAGTQGWWLDDLTGTAEYRKYAPVIRAAA